MLWVAFVSNDASKKVLVCSSVDGRNWTGNTQVHGESSKAAPSLALFSNRLWLAFIANNSSNKVLVCSAGGTWDSIGGAQHGAISIFTPAAVSDKPDTVHLFALASDKLAYHKFYTAGAWFPGGTDGDWECIGGAPCGWKDYPGPD